jgi:hypothetical protein
MMMVLWKGRDMCHIQSAQATEWKHAMIGMSNDDEELDIP